MQLVAAVRTVLAATAGRRLGRRAARMRAGKVESASISWKDTVWMLLAICVGGIGVAARLLRSTGGAAFGMHNLEGVASRIAHNIATEPIPVHVEPDFLSPLALEYFASAASQMQGQKAAVGWDQGSNLNVNSKIRVTESVNLSEDRDLPSSAAWPRPIHELLDLAQSVRGHRASVSVILSLNPVIHSECGGSFCFAVTPSACGGYNHLCCMHTPSAPLPQLGGALRQPWERETGGRLVHLYEATLLKYPAGGFYIGHVDRSAPVALWAQGGSH